MATVLPYYYPRLEPMFTEWEKDPINGIHIGLCFGAREVALPGDNCPDEIHTATPYHATGRAPISEILENLGSGYFTLAAHTFPEWHSHDGVFHVDSMSKIARIEEVAEILVTASQFLVQHGIDSIYADPLQEAICSFLEGTTPRIRGSDQATVEKIAGRDAKVIKTMHQKAVKSLLS